MKPSLRAPARLLEKMFAQFQLQLDEFEARVPNAANLEKETKLLCALAATLERLSDLGETMTKKQDKKHAAKAIDRGSVLRALCDRLEKLAKSDGPETKNKSARGNAD